MCAVFDCAGTLAGIFMWLGLEDEQSAKEQAGRVIEQVPIKSGTNMKYHARFCKALAQDGCRAYKQMVDDLETRVLQTGYSLREWGLSCNVPCAKQ